MNWVILIIAGLFEVGYTYSLGKTKEVSGNAIYAWYGIFVLCLIVSMVLLIKSVQGLPLGTAYAIWTGIGAVGTVIIGILVFKDPVSFWRLFFYRYANRFYSWIKVCNWPLEQ